MDKPLLELIEDYYRLPAALTVRRSSALIAYAQIQVDGQSTRIYI